MAKISVRAPCLVKGVSFSGIGLRDFPGRRLGVGGYPRFVPIYWNLFFIWIAIRRTKRMLKICAPTRHLVLLDCLIHRMRERFGMNRKDRGLINNEHCAIRFTDRSISLAPTVDALHICY